MTIVYLPDEKALFLHKFRWLPVALPELRQKAVPATTTLALGQDTCVVEGFQLGLADVVQILGNVPETLHESFPREIRLWLIATQLAFSLTKRERFTTTHVRQPGKLESRWEGVWTSNSDLQLLNWLDRNMILAPFAVSVEPHSQNVWHSKALLRKYIDDLVNVLVRQRIEARERAWSPRRQGREGSKQLSWNNRKEFIRSSFALAPRQQAMGSARGRWTPGVEVACDVPPRWRACFRIELPAPGSDVFVLRFLLQSVDDPSLIVLAADVWNSKGPCLGTFVGPKRDTEQLLRRALNGAAELFEPIARAFEWPHPEAVEMTPAEAQAFLAVGAPMLAKAGYGLMVPAELTPTGQRRFRMRMRVGGWSKPAGAVANSAGLGLDELVQVDWEAALGDDPLTPQELALLSERKSALVQFRGVWVVVDATELADVRKRMASEPSPMKVLDAIRVGLAGQTNVGKLQVSVSVSGVIADVLTRLRGASSTETSAPSQLRATLRPYQARGLHWLSTMMTLGLGACLADDMGLGKTIQFLACLLLHHEQVPDDNRPTLLVAPTSVVGNWEHEMKRFAPSLNVLSYYGPNRVDVLKQLPINSRAVVLTTYGLLRRDIEPLQRVDWSVAVLDEAQNIKNASSETAKAARNLHATHRVALTGTPVENRLAELWSILEFLNPGFMGPLDTFRRAFAVPIERYGDEAVANRLRRITGPFILRRLKSDSAIIQDLPAKNEMKVICTLTREQATLYKAVVDQEMRRIEVAEGIERRGRVLALLTYTKQICNHPAHYLGESGPLPKRSGKLARLAEMLEQAISVGDKALVFTQFREMGDRLVSYLKAALKGTILFLHGGTSKSARDEMVRRFQEESDNARIFVLSVKAGGTGLNLTAATHVFHYDRWWNPAVEDQATDRAYRIGQTRTVQVHKFVCAGTVEEKIDRLLEQKRNLAAKVVGSGEQWITEMNTNDLRSLFELSANAITSVNDDDEQSAGRTKTGPKRKPHLLPVEASS